MSLRRDGRPISESAIDRLLTLPDILVQEERLLALAERRLALGGVDHEVEATEELSGPQRGLAVAVAGDRALVIAVGPAGTGKTTAIRPAVDQLRREGRVVFGVAPSAAAAEVLAVDTGVDADTLDKLLIEHALDRPPDHRYDLPTGATVIVDEAAMVATPRLAELMELADRRGWRLALVGDPLQFTAVGRSGMFGHFVETFGAIELGRVHRFNHDWERDASLRLRGGDVSVVDLYEQHGRLHGGTAGQMRRAVVAAWWEAAERGETASMMAPTNAAVVALNREAQRRRLDACQLDDAGRSVEVGPYRIHVGDLVATRHNARQVVTDRGLMVKNRDRWTVEAVHRDGGLSVAGKTGNVRLPAEYVTEQVELAYAETSQANQGRTVDRSLLYLDGPTGSSGIYVPLTRGRESNECFVAIRGEEKPADVVAEALSRSWIDRPAISVKAELCEAGAPDSDDSRWSGRQALVGSAVRRLLQRAAELERNLSGARFGLDVAQTRIASLSRERQSLSRSIEEHEARLEAARRTVDELDRPLMRRRHRVELDGARRQLDWVPRAIEGERAKLAQLEGEERRAAERLTEAVALDASRPKLMAERTIVRSQLDQDARLRGEHPSVELAPVIIEHLGRKPADDAGAALWVDAVGRLAQHHAAFELPGTTLLGRQPRLVGDDVYASSHQAARQAIDRLDRPLGRQPEIEPPHMSLGLSL